MLGLFLTGMMVRRARWVSALCAVITGTAVIFWLSLPDVIRWLKRHGLESAAETCTKWADSFGGLSPFHPYMIPFWGTLVMVSIGFLISFFEPRPSMKDENNPETDLGMV